MSMTMERLAFARGLARRDPALLADYARWFFEGRRQRTPPVRQQQPDAITSDGARQLLAERLGHDTKGGAALTELSAYRVEEAARRGGGALMAGDSELGQIAYATVRAARPATVVETGVATGITSAHLLAALRDNGGGQLISVDLPPLDMLLSRTVGAAVPAAWRTDWSYRWGSAKRLLPEVLRSAPGPIVFVHDSDHSYEHMSWELRLAWERLGPGSVILSDDVDYHTAFRDVAASVGAEPHLVGQAEKQGTTGLLFR